MIPIIESQQNKPTTLRIATEREGKPLPYKIEVNKRSKHYGHEFFGHDRNKGPHRGH